MFLVWYDGDRKRSLRAKVEAAAARYQERFGTAPDLVLLNPAQVEDTREIAGIPVRTTLLVSPNHLYIGREEAEERAVLNSFAA